MSIGVSIKDGVDDKTAHVDNNHALRVSHYQPDILPVGTENRYRYLHGKLGSGGFNQGVLNQNIDGLNNFTDFYISASQDYDIYIMSIAIVIADGNIAHNLFGGINPNNLVNGWNLTITEQGEVTNLVDGAFTSGAIIAQTGFASPYGNAGTSWELTAWSGQTDAHTITMPIGTYIPGGIRLGRGSHDSLVSSIKDDYSSLVEFWVSVHGYKHYPAEVI